MPCFPRLAADCVGILLSLPFGILSDHWGRKPVLYLSVLGLMLSETWIRLVCKRSNTATPHENHF